MPKSHHKERISCENLYPPKTTHDMFYAGVVYNDLSRETEHVGYIHENKRVSNNQHQGRNLNVNVLSIIIENCRRKIISYYSL